MNDAARDMLTSRSIEARGYAYSKYSGFSVGAALLSTTGDIFTGCNVENVSFSLTICAERAAACNAVASGQSNWQALAIASKGGVSPCGACRQFLYEFEPSLRILCWDTDRGELTEHLLSDLLPAGFENFRPDST